MDIKQAERMGALLTLKELKVGSVVSKQDHEALQMLFGPVFETIPEPKTICDIRFTDNGSPIIAKGAENVTIKDKGSGDGS